MFWLRNGKILFQSYCHALLSGGLNPGQDPESYFEYQQSEGPSPIDNDIYHIVTPIDNGFVVLMLYVPVKQFSFMLRRDK